MPGLASGKVVVYIFFLYEHRDNSNGSVACLNGARPERSQDCQRRESKSVYLLLGYALNSTCAALVAEGRLPSAGNYPASSIESAPTLSPSVDFPVLPVIPSDSLPPISNGTRRASSTGSQYTPPTECSLVINIDQTRRQPPATKETDEFRRRDLMSLSVPRGVKLSGRFPV